MAENALATLLHVFEREAVGVPARGGRVLFFNATAEAAARLGADILAVQPFRPAFLELQRAGAEARAEAEAGAYAMGIVLCGRHRGRNEAWIAEADRLVCAGGTVLVAGLKTDGADSLRKRLARSVPMEGHAAKHHGVAFWFRAGQGLPEPAMGERVDGRFETAPGMFSHDRIDAGSRLLVENLPREMAGTVADLGAGWGYLPAEIAARCPEVSAIDLYEADAQAAGAAGRNMARLAPGLESRAFWADAVAEPPRRIYDWVVTNPPFHQGRAASVDLGIAMLSAAAGYLKPGGTMLAVANRHLPYEAALRRHFSRVEEVARNDAFKVLRALK